MSARSSLRLVADIGGTNARFALVDLEKSARDLIDPQGFKGEDFASLEDAIDHYLESRGGERPGSVVAAVAGPIEDGKAELTNGRWKMSESGLRGRGFSRARLINDYAALAYAVHQLQGDDLVTVGPEHPDADGTVAIIGAGTGLGAGALVRDGVGEAIAVTEGGHIAFAPTDDLEVEILQRLAGRFGRVSLERILSGPGLVNLYEALCHIRGREPADLNPEEVVSGAVDHADPIRAEALDRFCAIYGSAAGDFALAMGAKGGVYLAGGIAPKILDYLKASDFRARFEAKGRFQDYNAPIPTRVIMHPHAALLGAADAPIADKASQPIA